MNFSNFLGIQSLINNLKVHNLLPEIVISVPPLGAIEPGLTLVMIGAIVESVTSTAYLANPTSFTKITGFQAPASNIGFPFKVSKLQVMTKFKCTTSWQVFPPKVTLKLSLSKMRLPGFKIVMLSPVFTESAFVTI
jgi:hypothetical protein